LNGLQLRPGLTIRALPDGDAVVESANGRDAVIVNVTGHAILELLQTTRSEAEIASMIAAIFPGQDRGVIASDVAALVEQLVTAGVLLRCGDEPSTA
jgi:hypothetical protein